MIKNLFTCCETTLKKNEIDNNQSNEKGIINDEKNDKIKICNTNSKNSNNNKEETNQKRYSFISNITSNSKENQFKINENEQNKKNDIFYININSSFKENKNCINSKNPQFTTVRILNNEIKDNLKRRISLTQMNDRNNNKNPFFLDSRFLAKNHSLENSKKSFISLSSISEKSINKDLKGIIIEKKCSDGNVTFSSHINDEEIEFAPKLILTDLKSCNLFNGKVIKIDALGYKNGLRRKKDGKTYFGIKNNIDKKENDIIINIYDKKIKNNPLFVIFYDKIKTRYFIQYLNNDFNKNKLFMTIRIYNELFINKDEIRLLYLILGKLLITVSIGENDNLCFKIYQNSFSNNIENRRILEYNFKINDSPITIGRDKCSIIIDNNFISRVHATFIYGNNNKWCLIDGNEKRRHSTHGTWIILNNNIFELNPMNENYEVKIGEQAFNIYINTE